MSSPNKPISPNKGITNKSPSKQSPSSTSSPSPSSSNNNNNKLDQLDYLDSYFSSFASRIEKIDRSIDISKPNTLITAKHDLAQIIGDLESLQANEIDEFTGNNDGILQSKQLQAEIENMLEQTQLLYKQIDATLQRVLDDTNYTQTLNNNNNNNKSNSSSEPPLQREEIAKLLLLSARAHSIQQINVQQWRAIKDEICKRNGYLRVILKQNDISGVMNALSSLQLS